MKKWINNKYIKKIYNNINNNKFLFGLALIVVNLFSKYVELELTETQKEFIKVILTKELFIFIILFTGIKDIATSLLFTIIFTFISNTALNDESQFCIIPEKYKKLNRALDINNDNNITNDEIIKAKLILEKAKIEKNIFI